MLVVGAKGFAKEVLGILDQLNLLENLAFYDDIDKEGNSYLYSLFPILKSESEVNIFFSKNGNRFTVGIGNPHLRYKLYRKFNNLGGIFCSTISPTAQIGSYDVVIGHGCNILNNASISNSVKIGDGCIIYYNVIVTHDCTINDFVELSPNVTLLGNVEIGAFSQIGAGSTILPEVKIGANVIIGAGSVVTRNIPDNCMALGVPAKVIKQIQPLKFT